jgi:hypothetical protein
MEVVESAGLANAARFRPCSGLPPDAPSEVIATTSDTRPDWHEGLAVVLTKGFRGPVQAHMVSIQSGETTRAVTTEWTINAEIRSLLFSTSGGWFTDVWLACSLHVGPILCGRMLSSGCTIMPNNGFPEHPTERFSYERDGYIITTSDPHPLVEGEVLRLEFCGELSGLRIGVPDINIVNTALESEVHGFVEHGGFIKLHLKFHSVLPDVHSMSLVIILTYSNYIS